jgi:UDP-2,3-diacylglucosamine pyrophosphatase LpxH
MSTSKRLTEVFESAHEIPFDDSSKFVFFSDCHRGDNSWADDFAHNQTLLFHALNYYYNEGFTYIEVGDVDELWENRDFADIRRAHSHVFWLIRKFHTEQRFHLIWGNHDIERKDPTTVAKTLYRYYDDRSGEYKPLFEGIQVYEGITLRHADRGYSLFLVHGHQGDLINDRLWWLGRLFVRHFWRHLQLLGVRDPTSPAKNLVKQGQIEQKIIEWVKDKDQMTICGHTHRPMFPRVGEPLYFNTGSCVHPRCITGIEIVNGEIALIKWWVRPMPGGGLHVVNEPIVKPEKIEAFFDR